MRGAGARRLLLDRRAARGPCRGQCGNRRRFRARTKLQHGVAKSGAAWSCRRRPPAPRRAGLGANAADELDRYRLALLFDPAQIPDAALLRDGPHVLVIRAARRVQETRNMPSTRCGRVAARSAAIARRPNGRPARGGYGRSGAGVTDRLRNCGDAIGVIVAGGLAARARRAMALGVLIAGTEQGDRDAAALPRRPRGRTHIDSRAGDGCIAVQDDDQRADRRAGVLPKLWV